MWKTAKALFKANESTMDVLRSIELEEEYKIPKNDQSTLKVSFDISLQITMSTELKVQNHVNNNVRPIYIMHGKII